MPTVEHYDRVSSRPKLANNMAQEAYWHLRAELCATVALYWKDVLKASPEIAQADADLALLVARHHNVLFRPCRREDLGRPAQKGGQPFLM